ncbi:MAG: hypothetical protein RQ866_01570, partial [Bacteroidales bacterium]|nr:hypothetical protein [Bacteroidales bacterium]
AENSEINPLFGFFIQVSELMEYLPLLNAVSIVAAVINVIGLIFMWKLQKVGFYIYAVTEWAPVVIWSVIYFQVLGGLGLFMSTPAVIIALVFTFLYALNLKHMR